MNNKYFLFLAALAFIAPAKAQDIEIYLGTGTEVSEAATEALANVLLIADTSGSMNEFVGAELGVNPDLYDPDFNYDTTNDDQDDWIYVYDTPYAWSGVVIRPEQNKCDAITQEFANNPADPDLKTKAVQWLPTNLEDAYEELYNQCEIGLGIEDIEDKQIISVPNSLGETLDVAEGWVQVFSVPASEFVDETNDSWALRINADSPGGPNETLEFELRTYAEEADDDEATDDSLRATTVVCSKGQGASSRSVCNGDSSDFIDMVSLWVRAETDGVQFNGVFGYNLANNEKSTITTSSTPSADFIEACSFNLDADQNDMDWSPGLITSSEDAYILECRADDGVHGISEASTDVDAALCAGTCGLNEPNYLADNPTPLWIGSAGGVERYFYPQNYHDYLNYNSLTSEVAASVYDVRNTYYSPVGSGVYDTGNDGTKFSYTLDSWCDEERTNLATFNGFDFDVVGTFQEKLFRDSEDPRGAVYSCLSKLEVVKNVMKDVIESSELLNIGLMRFQHHGENVETAEIEELYGQVLAPIDDPALALSETVGDTHEQSLFDSIDGIVQGEGYTPLGTTLYDAYRYFRGLSLRDDEQVQAARAVSGGSFISPIADACYPNSIVYLTDGEPERDGGADDQIKTLTTSCDVDEVSDGNTVENCTDDLAGYMHETDLFNDIDGVNNVNTYTVGFTVDFPLLQDTADQGGGVYYQANDTVSLKETLEDIFDAIVSDVPSTLVAPAVSVNAFNELQHRSQIYYATFKPTATPKWEGNVKKYNITGEGIITDVNGDPAIDVATGFFDNSSQSFWSDIVDGPVVEVGGYRGELSATRNVYVDSEALTLGLPGTLTKLTPYESILNPGSQLSLAATGASTIGEAAELRDWILGIDIDDEDQDESTDDAHQYAGESLHSKPFVITYSGTSEADADDILFMTNNQGFITAVDASNGQEIWSYIPSETLRNVKVYRDNEDDADHVYGIDGEATVWAEEADGSTASNFDLGTAYMYQGMRRGGRTYFGWDISNADDRSGNSLPITELWKITGGSTSGFADLGQTWSKLTRTKLYYNCSSNQGNAGCTIKDVLVFGGGYDTYYDNVSHTFNENSESQAVLGNSVYIVDALTGTLLWSTGNSVSHSLQLPVYNSVPSDVNPIDVDGDGDMDMLYFIDLSGDVFRVDFDQTENITSENYTTGGQIADLSKASASLKFYHGLDIALNVAPGRGKSFFSISVGSGYRAHPRYEESWNNSFYVLIDENVSGPLQINTGTDEDPVYAISYQYVEDADSNRGIITRGDLHQFSNNDPFDYGTDGYFGYYRDFTGEHEKILQSSVTFNGDILISSYLPNGTDSASNPCGTAIVGSGRIYKFNVLTGQSTFDIDGDGVVDDSDAEYIDLAHEGIPPDPTILLVPELVTCIGTECSDEWLELETGQAERTYWREE